MTSQTPDLPPSESLGYWENRIIGECENVDVILIEAWQAGHKAGHKAGADQELEACCEWLTDQSLHLDGSYLRADRRPKPPSLKEQALAALDDAVMRGDCITISDALPTLRRALEQLND
jgi:hypothetical protein